MNFLPDPGGGSGRGTGIVLDSLPGDTIEGNEYIQVNDPAMKKRMLKKVEDNL